jgi:hypothetical protein
LKNLIPIFIISGLLVTGLNSCKKDPGPAFDMGYNYFPDEIGTYVVYNVDSIFYDDRYTPSKKDTFKFQIKEKIQSVFNDSEGRPTMRLERSVKYFNADMDYALMNWKLKDVWIQNKTKRTAEKVEEDVRYIKLAFPVTSDKKWNGNAYNTNPEENYSYNFIDLARTVGNIRFDSVLQVDQHNETNLISQIISEEKYARNVGMIYKKVIDVDSQYPASWNSNPPLPYLQDSLSAFYAKPILERATSGYQYTMTVTSFGKE